MDLKILFTGKDKANRTAWAVIPQFSAEEMKAEKHAERKAALKVVADKLRKDLGMPEAKGQLRTISAYKDGDTYGFAVVSNVVAEGFNSVVIAAQAAARPVMLGKVAGKRGHTEIT